MSGRALIGVLAACAVAMGLVIYRAQFAQGPPAAPPSTGVVIVAPSPAGSTATPGGPTPSPSPTALPASVRIQVPYTPQAPHDDWTTHEDNCEAAALVMYAAYLHHDTRSNIPPRRRTA